MNKLSLAKMGDKNPMWKGDKVGYMGVHTYVRKRIRKPKWCVKCKKRPAIDLSNISGKYLRDLTDWEYLCRKCHMDGDGRNEQLRLSGKSRKLPNKFCEICKKEFHRDDREAKYCSRKCWSMGMIKNRVCEICPRKHYGKGLCNYHYQQKKFKREFKL